MIISFLGDILGKIMSVIYYIVNDYGLSIIIFTFLTKFILFPVNMITQKNSINMVRLMPEENNLKTKYIDDKSKLADEQLKLYKKYNYRPILSTIPLLIQIPLVLGLVYVIYHPLSYMLSFDDGMLESIKEWAKSILSGSQLEENSYQLAVIGAIKSGAEAPSYLNEAVSKINSLNTSFLGLNLSMMPSFSGNYELLSIPFLSGLSAWLLCFVQNKINILQVAQSELNKWITTIFLIVFSTYFAFLVPAGVGLYWIFGNLFSIPVMYALNWVMPPQKYIDLTYLKLTNEKFKEKEKERKKYSSREKADFKRFFAQDNAELVIYSESNGFYKYYKGMIDYICENSDIKIHYVTSDPHDNIFKDEREQIIGYYIASDRYLIPFFMKLDCKICAMTMPDLEKYHIKRSRVKKDIEYIKIPHGAGSYALTYRKNAVDYFDTVFCTGIDNLNEIRESEQLYSSHKKRLVEAGYPLIDELIEMYESKEHKKNEVPIILIAPSWQPDNIIDLCGDELLSALSDTNYEIILRPHPQQVRHESEKFDLMKKKYEKNKNILIQTDFSSNTTISDADILITDWSDIAWEFSFSTKKPVLFIDTPMKIMNPEYDKIKTKPVNITLREIVGKVVSPEKMSEIKSTVDYLLTHRQEYEKIIEQTRNEHIYNVGKSKIIYGRYIIKRLRG